MPQRVLYLLNISNPARLAADSGWIFVDLLARALAGAGVVVTIPAPLMGTLGPASRAPWCPALAPDPGCAWCGACDG
jgi:hypothetical protein